MRNIAHIFTLLIISLEVFGAQTSQDALFDAKRLWQSGNCQEALSKMRQVMKKAGDFPEQIGQKVRETYSAWRDTFDEQVNIYKQILDSIPPVSGINGEPLPLDQLQKVRNTIAELMSRSDEIRCKDLRAELKKILALYQDTVNLYLDNYIDILISENARLSTAVDSLRKLAKRYHHILPILDSLRTIIIQSADKIELLQSQLDSIVLMATQATSIVRHRYEEAPTSISQPTKLASSAMLELVESRVIAIGEGKIRKQKFTKAQRDSLLSELNGIVIWLDTSMVARISPEKSAALKELTYKYTDILTRPSPRNSIVWIVLGALIIVILIAVAQALRRNR